MNNHTSPIPNTAMTPDATDSLLHQQEKIIQQGFEGFVRAGNALKMIKDNKLYKHQYGTYQEYCTTRWGFTPQHANRLIKASELIDRMRTEPTGSLLVLPQSEHQTRALLRSEHPTADWKEVQQRTGHDQPTAAEISEHLRGQHTEEEEVIEAEIDDAPPEASTAKTVSNPLLYAIMELPAEMGTRTGNPQVSCHVDDATYRRYTELHERLGLPKQNILSKALLFLERSLDATEDILPSATLNQKDKS